MKQTMKRLVLVLVGVVALGCTAPLAASAANVAPGVLCGSCSGDGGGPSGCWQVTADHSAGLPYLSWVRHYLVVNYCKSNGVITSISIAAHGCDTRGLAFCHVGPAWRTGGGVGSWSASFEAHATWGVTVVPIYNNNDVMTFGI